MSARPLTVLEKQFVKEAQEGHFGLYFRDDGSPAAMGATGTGNLFEVDVVEVDDHFNRGSIYSLRGEES